MQSNPTPARLARLRDERRAKTAAILAAHHELGITDRPGAWIPGDSDTYAQLGIGESEYAATAERIAEVTTCSIGDAAGQLELIATCLAIGGTW